MTNSNVKKLKYFCIQWCWSNELYSADVPSDYGNASSIFQWVKLTYFHGKYFVSSNIISALHFTMTNLSCQGNVSSLLSTYEHVKLVPQCYSFIKLYILECSNLFNFIIIFGLSGQGLVLKVYGCHREPLMLNILLCFNIQCLRDYQRH